MGWYCIRYGLAAFRHERPTAVRAFSRADREGVPTDMDVEVHFGEEVLVTRKGAISARAGELGIIPGSMGTRSYIVRGLGNPASFHSASHGAGRRMSRREAKRRYSADDLRVQTEGVECRKDPAVVDEIPAAYKDIDRVMAQQSDLVEVVAELKQVLCVKG